MGHSKASQTKAIAAENRRKAFEYRKAGITYADIGKTLGVSEKTAYIYVRGELDRIAKETGEKAEELRVLETERLDKIFQHGYSALVNGDLKGADVCLKTMDRRARLYGLDAPAKTELSGNIAASGEWRELKAILICALSPHPEALAAVVRAIEQEAKPE